MLESGGEYLPAEINRRKPMSKRRIYAKERMQNRYSQCLIHIQRLIHIYVITASDPQSKRDHPTKQVGAAEDCVSVLIDFLCVRVKPTVDFRHFGSILGGSLSIMHTYCSARKMWCC